MIEVERNKLKKGKAKQRAHCNAELAKMNSLKTHFGMISKLVYLCVQMRQKIIFYRHQLREAIDDLDNLKAIHYED